MVNNDSGNIETLIGKIRGFEGDKIRVSLWDSEQQETVGCLPRNYFPEAELEVGKIFKYRAKVTVEMVPEREVSDKEIAELWAEIKRNLPYSEF